ncbi:MAG: hypothetical protein JXD18_09250 [Anaerolineae bacterium]|nr:hypothetical protein [Anaerolineae bacterium]
MSDVENEWIARLGAALEVAVDAALAPVEDGRAGLLYSAGLDSALLARLSLDVGRAPLLLSVGTVFSRDRKFVTRAQPYLDLPVAFVTVGEDEIAAALPVTEGLLRAAGILTDFDTLNHVHLSVGVGMLLACRAARERGRDLLLSAHGADALFAGFDRYQRVSLEQLPATLRQDVQASIDVGLARDRAIAGAFGVELAAPFLEPAVVELVHAIPIALKVDTQANKPLLRALARRRGLPEFIVRRPKRSMQFSTGIWKVVKRFLT